MTHQRFGSDGTLLMFAYGATIMSFLLGCWLGHLFW